MDNYAHGLIIAAKALYKGSPALGKFYIVTDGDTHPFSDGYAHFWEVVDRFSHAMGFTPISSKWKLPAWLLLPVAYICDFIGMEVAKCSYAASTRPDTATLASPQVCSRARN